MQAYKPHLMIRLLLASVLGLLAVIPTYIVVGTMPALISAPGSFSMAEYVIFSACLPFAYFLWLLCWRALTWRSNRADGRLMPPVALTWFIAAFGVVGAMVVLVSLQTREYYNVVPGLLFLLMACVALASHRDRLNKKGNKDAT